MFGTNRNTLRQSWFEAWQKQQNKQPLDALEQRICQIIQMHPEYHRIMSQPKRYLNFDFSHDGNKDNPFLHLSLHLGLHEQISTNRPIGIQMLYQQLKQKTTEIHQTEHIMMDCLGLTLWEAQCHNQAPNEKNYLECLQKALQQPL